MSHDKVSFTDNLSGKLFNPTSCGVIRNLCSKVCRSSQNLKIQMKSDLARSKIIKWPVFFLFAAITLIQILTLRLTLTLNLTLTLTLTLSLTLNLTLNLTLTFARLKQEILHCFD